MSNARDDRDRLQHNRKRKGSESILTASEEIGQMHFSTENYTTAIEYFQEALKSSELKDYPDRYRLFLRLCDCHRKKGDYRGAHKFLQLARALLSDPVPPDALGKIEYREAHGLLVEGRYEQALKRGFAAYRRLKHSSEHGEVAYIQLLLANCDRR